MASLVRNLLSRGMRVAVPALESLATGLPTTTAVRAMHWQRAMPAVLAKIDTVSEA